MPTINRSSCLSPVPIMIQALNDHMQAISKAKQTDEDLCLDRLMAAWAPDPEMRTKIEQKACDLVCTVRKTHRPAGMDALLAEYGLATEEGVALLRLAEALFRVPDGPTQDNLILDKLVGPDWTRHRGKSPSRWVNVTTIALQLATALLRSSQKKSGPPASWLQPAIKIPIRLVTRKAVALLAAHFVHGKSIEDSMARARRSGDGEWQYSFDMLGEAALTKDDAQRFDGDYRHAITMLAAHCHHDDFRQNPGISVKLSALHPRYELTKSERVIRELGDRLYDLALMAKNANMGLNIDAEEADRLELSLQVIERVLRREELRGWDGFGVVVQAYGKAAPHVLDWLHALAEDLDCRIMVRLVKGAYWDTEIKRAQVEGVDDFPVYTRKAATDVAYLCCARKLLGMTDRIYPQFAGHNAHTIVSILEFASKNDSFEFQRIHGMGEPVHGMLQARHGRICRVYAPVGQPRELLPYLARRILENGANSSFVNQIADVTEAPEAIARDPFALLEAIRKTNEQPIEKPPHLFGQDRINSRGWDLHDPSQIAHIDRLRHPHIADIRDGSTDTILTGPLQTVTNPARPAESVGQIRLASAADVEAAYTRAQPWNETTPASERARILREVADRLEQDAGEFFALLAREAGKTLDDATAELREGVDFLRYYAAGCLQIRNSAPLGIVACISPWNFPLAIFTGQCSAALAAGNAVLAKPAGQTTLIAHAVVQRFHQSGVPPNVLQLLPGSGHIIGEAIVTHPLLAGVAFTGSTETAQRINRSLSHARALAPRLVAETGGLNAMIVDSTALPEQAIRDIIDSAFRSAGQRCSALRMLYLQAEIADSFLAMLYGAMHELTLGDPWALDTDIGPVIDDTAARNITAYVDKARAAGHLLFQLPTPGDRFVAPTVIRVDGIADLQREIFGPVLHVATFRQGQIDTLVDAINRTGYGLTFGVHTRIDRRATALAQSVAAGNIYINRNQIGAVVGSQPFGGEGLSGTGPKAGGPAYLRAFRRTGVHDPVVDGAADGDPASFVEVQRRLNALGSDRDIIGTPVPMPGPTGEANHLSHHARGTVLCLGPGPENAARQADIARRNGCQPLIVTNGAVGDEAITGVLSSDDLVQLQNFDLVALWGDEARIRDTRDALAQREGPIIPLAIDADMESLCQLERHVCIDTTAAGGNTALYASMGRG